MKGSSLAVALNDSPTAKAPALTCNAAQNFEQNDPYLTILSDSVARRRHVVVRARTGARIAVVWPAIESNETESIAVVYCDGRTAGTL